MFQLFHGEDFVLFSIFKEKRETFKIISQRNLIRELTHLKVIISGQLNE